MSVSAKATLTYSHHRHHTENDNLGTSHHLHPGSIGVIVIGSVALGLSGWVGAVIRAGIACVPPCPDSTIYPYGPRLSSKWHSKSVCGEDRGVGFQARARVQERDGETGERERERERERVA